jgi:predicted permease
VTSIFWRDARRGLRSWRRTPGSALLVVLALGLSGGALIALVNLVNSVFWREVRVDRPEELVGISSTDRHTPEGQTVGTASSLFASLEGTEQVFRGFAGFVDFDSVAVVNDTSRRLAVEGVTGRYFETLSLRPALGRFVAPLDDERASPVATISFRWWKSGFGSDADVIGKTFRLQGELITVVGIAPSSFTGLEIGVPADAWVPASLAPRLLDQPPNLIFFDALVGRLRPGVGLQQARGEIESLWPSARQAAADVVAASWPQAREDVLALQPRVASAATGFSPYRDFYRRPLTLLMLSSLVTVLLAGVNLSGLLLARWSTRDGDHALQSALGASTWRLLSQLFAESLALSLVAVMLSVPIALGSARSLTLLLWDQTNGSPLDLSVDHRVVGVMVALIGFVASCVSLLPAYRIWSGTLTLNRGTRGSGSRSVTRWGQWLAAAQIALSVPLLVAAWLVAVNLHRLEGVNTGFRADDVIVASLAGQGGVAPSGDPVSRLVEMSSALRAAPGITSAALCWREPVSGIGNGSRQSITTGDGRREAKPFVQAVSPGYVDTLSIPLVAGRDFTWADDSQHGRVALVSAGLAQTIFPNANPIGQHIRVGGQFPEIIGVIADAHIANPHETSQPILLTALLQQPPRLLDLDPPLVLVKSPLSLPAVQALAHRALVALGRDDIVTVHSLQHTLEAVLLRERLMRMGAFYFAGLTTLLVFIGLQAVLNVGIARRIPEIGLRIALGASTADVRMMVIREAGLMAAAGLAAGIPLAIVASRLLATTITFGSSSLSAVGIATATTVVVAVFALVIPVRMATRVAPTAALSGQ